MNSTTELVRDEIAQVVRSSADGTIEDGLAELTVREARHPSSGELMAYVIRLDPVDPAACSVFVQLVNEEEIQVHLGQESGFIALWDEPKKQLLENISRLVVAAVNGRVRNTIEFDDGSVDFAAVTTEVFDEFGEVLFSQIYHNEGRGKSTRERTYSPYRT